MGIIEKEFNYIISIHIPTSPCFVVPNRKQGLD